MLNPFFFTISFIPCACVSLSFVEQHFQSYPNLLTYLILSSPPPVLPHPHLFLFHHRFSYYLFCHSPLLQPTPGLCCIPSPSPFPNSFAERPGPSFPLAPRHNEGEITHFTRTTMHTTDLHAFPRVIKRSLEKNTC